MDSSPPHPERTSSEQPFVPHGVDAASWFGFEQRIQERRFRVLVDTAREALAAGDRDAADDALAEARTLRPDAAELDALRQPPLLTPAEVQQQRHRAQDAVALLALGVALLLVVDAFRYPAPPPAPPSAPAFVVAPDAPVAVATTGAIDDARPAEEQPPPAREQEVPLVRHERERDVAAPPPASLARTNAVPAALERSLPMSAPIPVSVPLPVPPPAPAAVEVETVPAPVIPAAVAADGPAIVPADETRVAATLQRYARAYTNLDARAARNVWPSVDERALSNAFAGLSAQSLDFRDCEVVVRQVEADAVCHGTASYVPRVGSTSPRVEPRTWHFELSRHGDDWLIDSAVARR